jgi:RNA polymerase-interacting CarD/CdnL/TRCF family regulator/tetratricopeptide (TPR) repeat protein
MSMTAEDILPGALVYYPKHGLSVVVGKKTIDLSQLPGVTGPASYDVWELRVIDNPHTPISIPSNKILTSGIRKPASKEEILAAMTDILDIKGSRVLHLHGDKEKQLQPKLSASVPKEVALALTTLTAKHKGTAIHFGSLPNTHKMMALNAVKLLADDLSMASGLSFGAAKSHIAELSLSKAYLPVWPPQALSPKEPKLDEDTFLEAFGITFEQAMDLDANPPKVPEKSNAPDGRVKDTLTQILVTSIDEGSSTGIPTDVKRFFIKHPEYQRAFEEVAQSSPLRGLNKKAMEIAIKTLQLNEFYVLAWHVLVKPEARKTLEDISGHLNISVSDAVSLREKAISKFKQEAINAKREDLIRQVQNDISYTHNLAHNLTSDEGISESVSAEDGKISILQQNKRLYDELEPITPSRGPVKGGFHLAGAYLRPEEFKIFSSVFLLRTDHCQTLESYAQTNGLRLDAARLLLQGAVRTFGHMAQKHHRTSYITNGMVEICPELAELRKTREQIAKTDISDFDEIIKPELKPFVEREIGNISSTGVASKLFKIASCMLTPDTFRVYVPVELRRKELQISLETVAQELGLSMPDAVALRDQAIDIIQSELDRQGYVFKNAFRALTSSTCPAKKAAKAPDVVWAQPAKDVETPHSGNDVTSDTHTGRCEDDIYAGIKINGFDSKSLGELGEIYQRQGKLDLALAFYGAANDLSDNDPKLRAKLEIIEDICNTAYDPEAHFATAESFIQAKLNEGIEQPIPFIQDHEPSEEPAEVIEPSSSHRSRSERVFATATHERIPQVTYAIPAEALVFGQRLKMTFNYCSNGSMEVTLEVEVAAASASKPNGSARHHNAANGKGNGMLRAEFHQDGSTATVSVFSDARNDESGEPKPKVS